MARSSLSPRLLRLAADIARKSPVSLDDLPYTEHFDRLLRAFCSRSGFAATANEFWLYLVGARKRGLVGRRQQAGQDNARH